MCSQNAHINGKVKCAKEKRTGKDSFLLRTAGVGVQNDTETTPRASLCARRMLDIGLQIYYDPSPMCTPHSQNSLVHGKSQEYYGGLAQHDHP